MKRWKSNCVAASPNKTFAAAGFSSMPIPLLPLQILYLNVVTDVFPALALGTGKGDPDVIQREPRSHQESMLTHRYWSAIGGWAVFLAACVLLLMAAVYLPGISNLLQTENPTRSGWLVVLGMSLVPLVCGQALRIIQNLRAG